MIVNANFSLQQSRLAPPSITNASPIPVKATSNVVGNLTSENYSASNLNLSPNSSIANVEVADLLVKMREMADIWKEMSNGSVGEYSTMLDKGSDFLMALIEIIGKNDQELDINSLIQLMANESQNTFSTTDLKQDDVLAKLIKNLSGKGNSSNHSGNIKMSNEVMTSLLFAQST